MLSIIWTDSKPPSFGQQVIISPTKPSPCCESHMEILGHPHDQERWAWQVKRCSACGYTVRKIIQEYPRYEDYSDLRKRMAEGQLTKGPY